MRKPYNDILCVSKKDGFVLERDLAMKNHELLTTVFTTILWEKPAWAAVPILLISTLLMRA